MCYETRPCGRCSSNESICHNFVYGKGKSLSTVLEETFW